MEYIQKEGEKGIDAEEPLVYIEGITIEGIPKKREVYTHE